MNSTRSQERSLNQLRVTVFAQPVVSATFTHNQLTQGSIQTPLHTTISPRQKNLSGSNTFSSSTVRFDNSPGTTTPHDLRNALSLATGNTFVAESEKIAIFSMMIRHFELFLQSLPLRVQVAPTSEVYRV